MYLVTGASGGIGKRVVAELLKRDEVVIGLYGSNYPGSLEGAHLIKYDLSNGPAIFADPLLNTALMKNAPLILSI